MFTHVRDTCLLPVTWTNTFPLWTNKQNALEAMEISVLT
jgi:hypothetical protein